MADEETHLELDRARFERSWRALGAAHARAFDTLAHSYAERHRAYHDAEHIVECLAWLDRVADRAERATELEVALYFHDAVYEPTARDNEARSAELFRALAREAGIGGDAVERIAALILSTASHDASDGDAALLSDIDLAILGASPARYARYERAVRREYAAIDDAVYRAGRARLLGSLLERLAIYRTPEMAARLEAQARQNLARALDALRD